MKKKDIKALKPGDKVRWTDPDNDPETDCSKDLVIVTARIHGDMVQIVDMDGGYLECLPSELSRL